MTSKSVRVRSRDDGEEQAIVQNKSKPIVWLPEIILSPMFMCTRRFVNNTAAVSAFLTIADLLNQFLVAQTSVLANTYVRAVRIRKIRILSPVTTQGTSVTLSIQPRGIDSGNNSFNAVPERYLDTSASIDIPAYIALKPSMESPLGSWHYNTTVSTNLAAIIAPKGSTMDISFEFILNTEDPASGYTVTIAAATAGTLYARTLLTSFDPQNNNVI